ADNDDTLARYNAFCIRVEERAGHHVKLHEYCSTDVEGMVQRHLNVRFLPLSFSPQLYVTD
ncbi:hypothetical protein DFH11DRAFT_1512620, partial [Phellopilus nigrolimitatus]